MKKSIIFVSIVILVFLILKLNTRKQPVEPETTTTETIPENISPKKSVAEKPTFNPVEFNEELPEQSPDKQTEPQNKLRKVIIRSDGDINNLINLVSQYGGKVTGRMNALSVIEVEIYANDLLRLQENAQITVWENSPVWLPPTEEAVAPDGVTYYAFGNNVLKWLNVPSDNKSWGDSVNIAVLDTGIPTSYADSKSNINAINIIPLTENSPNHGYAVVSLLAGTDTVQGISPSATITSIRVLDDNASGDIYTLCEGIYKAVESGADVISLSLCTSVDNSFLREAIEYASNNGCVIVAAVGNDGQASVSYPAAYDNVVAVGGVDAAGQHLYFSNTGDVDITAPAYGVTAATDGGTTLFSGTSAAAPLVAGVIATLDSDSDTPVAELLAAADDYGEAGWDEEYGEGVLNAGRATTDEDIYDMAAIGCTIKDSSNAEEKILVASMENRGTLTAGYARLEVKLADQYFRTTFSDTPVSKTVTYEVVFPFSIFQDKDEVEYVVTAILLSAQDANSANNVSKGRIQATAKEE